MHVSCVRLKREEVKQEEPAGTGWVVPLGDIRQSRAGQGRAGQASGLIALGFAYPPKREIWNSTVQ